MSLVAEGKLYVTEHAIERLRHHFREVQWRDDKYLRRELADRVVQGKSRSVEMPGGLYVPISFEGDDGFAVLHGDSIVTVLPEKWCADANNIVKEMMQ